MSLTHWITLGCNQVSFQCPFNVQPLCYYSNCLQDISSYVYVIVWSRKWGESVCQCVKLLLRDHVQELQCTLSQSMRFLVQQFILADIITCYPGKRHWIFRNIIDLTTLTLSNENKTNPNLYWIELDDGTIAKGCQVFTRKPTQLLLKISPTH